MDTINVRICTGTTCFIMGASHFDGLAALLPSDLTDRINIEASHCLGFCDDPAAGRPPFVMVNDAVVSGATVDSIIEAVRCAAADGDAT